MPKTDFNELFGESIGPEEHYVDFNKTVPNIHPRISNVPYRLAIIGETPGKDEIEQGRPFVGFSGRELDRFLSRFGILRDACFVGNVCQHRPSYNRIASFDWNGPEIQSGITKLQNDLSTFNPNVVLLLGGSALHLAKSGPGAPPPKRKTKEGLVFAYPNSVSDWRGSFFYSPFLVGNGVPVKCIASYHPAVCLRQYEWTPMLMMDVKRAFDEATTKELVLPQRRLLTNLNFHEVLEELDKLLTTNTRFGCDIEGNWFCLKCVSFAPSPDYSFVVPLARHNGEAIWSLEEEITITKKLVQVLSSPRLIKVWQNGLYDRFVFLQFGIIVR